MKFTIYQVDAFTNKLFGGNPAAVIPLNEWLDAALMQNIAAENNLAETVFLFQKKTATISGGLHQSLKLICAAMLLWRVHLCCMNILVMQNHRLFFIQKAAN